MTEKQTPQTLLLLESMVTMWKSEFLNKTCFSSRIKSISVWFYILQSELHCRLAGVLSGVFCSLCWSVVAIVRNVSSIGTFWDFGAHFVSISSAFEFSVTFL